MITHRDTLTGVSPAGGPAVVIAQDVRPAVLESARKMRAANGWTSLVVVPCLACTGARELVPA